MQAKTAVRDHKFKFWAKASHPYFKFFLLNKLNVFYDPALVIILTQMTRCIFRGTPDQFCGDSKALSVTLTAIFRGYHRQGELE